MTTQDLTQLTTPFGLLPPETQQALREWHHGWELFRMNRWHDCMEPDLSGMTYRAKPAPAIPDTINWEHVVPRWQFMARDSDGEVYFYDQKPSYVSGKWYPANGWARIVETHASYTRGTLDWRDSLVARKE